MEGDEIKGESENFYDPENDGIIGDEGQNMEIFIRFDLPLYGLVIYSHVMLRCYFRPTTSIIPRAPKI